MCTHSTYTDSTACSLEHSDNEAVLHMHSYVGREEEGRKKKVLITGTHIWMKYPEMRER